MCVCPIPTSLGRRMPSAAVTDHLTVIEEIMIEGIMIEGIMIARRRRRRRRSRLAVVYGRYGRPSFYGSTRVIYETRVYTPYVPFRRCYPPLNRTCDRYKPNTPSKLAYALVLINTIIIPPRKYSF